MTTQNYLNVPGDLMKVPGAKCNDCGSHDIVKAAPVREQCWECNECGAQEYTMCVSEADVQNLGCGSCGGDEWHKADVRR